MTLAPDTRLGPYSIISLLGVGGMGEVYAAVDTRLHRKVAIKISPAHVAGDPEFRKRLEREAKSISSLNHPYICTLYDIGAQDGIDFLVLQYLEGTTLADRLAHEPLSLEEALRSGFKWPMCTMPRTNAASCTVNSSRATSRLRAMAS
jgi:serine/threonine protein kinase